MQTLTTKKPNKLTLASEAYELRKYKILEIIEQKPANYARLLKRNIPILLQINRQTWSNWLNAQITDKLEIPSIKLGLIANYLDVSIEQLINVKLKTEKIQTDQQKIKNQIIAQTGLTK